MQKIAMLFIWAALLSGCANFNNQKHSRLKKVNVSRANQVTERSESTDLKRHVDVEQSFVTFLEIVDESDVKNAMQTVDESVLSSKAEAFSTPNDLASIQLPTEKRVQPCPSVNDTKSKAISPKEEHSKSFLFLKFALYIGIAAFIALALFLLILLFGEFLGFFFGGLFFALGTIAIAMLITAWIVKIKEINRKSERTDVQELVTNEHWNKTIKHTRLALLFTLFFCLFAVAGILLGFEFTILSVVLLVIAGLLYFPGIWQQIKAITSLRISSREYRESNKRKPRRMVWISAFVWTRIILSSALTLLIPLIIALIKSRKRRTAEALPANAE